MFVCCFSRYRKPGHHLKCPITDFLLLHSAKLIDNTKEGTEKLQSLFGEVEKNADVEMNKFTEIVNRLAEDQGKSVDEVNKRLADQGPKLMESIKAGVKAFAESLGGGSSSK